MTDALTTTTTPHFAVDAEFSYSMTNDAGEEVRGIDEFLDAVAEHLSELDALDIAIILDESNRSFALSLLVGSHEYESIETVVGKAMGMMRTAFHTCNVRTPHWPTPDKALLSVRVTPAVVRGAADDRISSSHVLASV